MPRVPGNGQNRLIPIYPFKRIWDRMIDILSAESFLANNPDPTNNGMNLPSDQQLPAGILFNSESCDLSLFRLPLTQETIRFSDANYAVSVWYENQKSINYTNPGNSMQKDIYQFYIDVAYQDEDLEDCIVKCSETCEDIVYTFQGLKNLSNTSGTAGDDSLGMMWFDKIEPTEPPRGEQMFVFTSTIPVRIETFAQYR